MTGILLPPAEDRTWLWTSVQSRRTTRCPHDTNSLSLCFRSFFFLPLLPSFTLIYLTFRMVGNLQSSPSCCFMPPMRAKEVGLIPIQGAGKVQRGEAPGRELQPTDPSARALSSPAELLCEV